MIILYRGPLIDASYQVSVHLAMRFQKRRIFKITQLETRFSCGGYVLNIDICIQNAAISMN
jgi:hypothetical protein